MRIDFTSSILVDHLIKSNFKTISLVSRNEQKLKPPPTWSVMCPRESSIKISKSTTRMLRLNGFNSSVLISACIEAFIDGAYSCLDNGYFDGNEEVIKLVDNIRARFDLRTDNLYLRYINAGREMGDRMRKQQKILAPGIAKRMTVRNRGCFRLKDAIDSDSKYVEINNLLKSKMKD